MNIENSPQTIRLALVYEVVNKLKDTGKIRLQKLMYFLQEAFDVPTNYSFRMHHYGPYSDALDGDLSLAKALGHIEIEPDSEGFGYHVTPIKAASVSWSITIAPSREQIDNAISLLGSLRTWELELDATIHFVSELGASASEDEISNTVRSLKPKFTIEIIRSAYGRLLESDLIHED